MSRCVSKSRRCAGASPIGVPRGAARLEPRIVGAARSPTPIFNWLLFGYGVPALAFGFAARLMRPRGEDTPVRVAYALAVLFSAFLVFFEIRHFAQRRRPVRARFGSCGAGLDGGLVVRLRHGADAARRGARQSGVQRRTSLAAGAVGGLVTVFGLFARAGHPFLMNTPVEGGLISTRCCSGIALPAALAGGLALAARRVRPPWYWGGAGVSRPRSPPPICSCRLRVFFHGARSTPAKVSRSASSASTPRRRWRSPQSSTRRMRRSTAPGE